MIRALGTLAGLVFGLAGWLALFAAGLLLALWALVQTAPGLRLVERGAEAGLGAAGFEAQVDGLVGPLPGRLGVARLVLADADGVWLELEGLRLDWNPGALRRGVADIAVLAADRLRIERLPAAAPAEPEPEETAASGPLHLPVDVALGALQIGRLELGPSMPGGPAAFALDGAARLGRDSLSFLGGGPGGDGTARLALDRLDRPADRLALDLGLDGARIDLRAQLSEAEGGALATLAGLPALPAGVRLTLAGPLEQSEVTASVALGPELTAQAEGELDLRALRGTLRLSADARPAPLAALLPPGLAWTTLGLAAQIEGDLTAPMVEAGLRIERPAFGTTASASAVRLEATVHPAQGGSFAIALDGAVEALAVEGLPPPLAEALGRDRVVLEAAATLAPDNRLALDTLRLAHPVVAVALSGEAAADRLALELLLERLDLAPLGQGLDGSLAANLRIEGAPSDPRITGLVGTDRIERDGLVSGPLTLHLDASPLAERQRLAARLAGVLAGTAADLRIEAERGPEGLALSIPGGQVAGATIEAEAKLAPGAPPTGRLRLDAPDLAPFGRLAGEPLAGRAQVAVVLDACETTLTCLEANGTFGGIRAAGIALRDANFEASARDVTGTPGGRAQLKLEGLQASGFAADATLDAEGDLGGGVELRLEASGPDLTTALRGRLAMPEGSEGRFDLAQLRLGWKGEVVELASPASIAFGGGRVAVDRLRLNLRDGRLELAGEAGERLAIELTARGLPLALAELAGVAGLSGRLDAEARIGGTQAAPSGDARVTLRQVESTAVDWLPPASLDATARLAGSQANLTLAGSAGPGIRTNVTGTIGTAGDLPLGLDLDGTVEGRALDPLLLPAGRRLQGTLRLRGRVGGTSAAPTPDLRLTMAEGALRSAVAGLSFERIGLSVRLLNDQVTVERATARVGTGSVELAGTVRPLASPPEAALRFIARGAEVTIEPYATARISADLALNGQGGPLAASGRIDVERAEIRIPDRLPSTIVDLPVREVGGGRVTTAAAAPAAPEAQAAAASALPPVDLAISIRAPRAVFVRGRGIDAEFGGAVELGGSIADPSLQGGLELRRGTLDLLGNRIDIQRGIARFRGGLTPDLDVLARTAAADVVATLAVTGPPDALQFTLGSEPTLPQDEILSRFLFGKAASGLSPLELLELGRAVAELTGMGGGGAGFDPVGRIREGLRLDRLAVSGGGDGAGPSVEAGRYVADGVYVGAVQGAEAGSGRARVEIEIAPGLALRAESGTTDSGGPRAGIVYRFEY